MFFFWQEEGEARDVASGKRGAGPHAAYHLHVIFKIVSEVFVYSGNPVHCVPLKAMS